MLRLAHEKLTFPEHLISISSWVRFVSFLCILYLVLSVDFVIVILVLSVSFSWLFRLHNTCIYKMASKRPQSLPILCIWLLLIFFHTGWGDMSCVFIVLDLSCLLNMSSGLRKNNLASVKWFSFSLHRECINLKKNNLSYIPKTIHKL